MENLLFLGVPILRHITVITTELSSDTPHVFRSVFSCVGQQSVNTALTLLHLERPKLYAVLVFLNAIGFMMLDYCII